MTIEVRARSLRSLITTTDTEGMAMGDAREVVGYTVIGPMESVCIEDAPTPEDARRMYEEKYRWVADVFEIHEGETATLDEVRCVVCDRLLAG